MEKDDSPLDSKECVKNALKMGRPKYPCGCEECSCELHSHSDADVCIWCRNGDHGNTEIPDQQFGSDEWKRAMKRAIVIDYRGPYTTPDAIDTIEGQFEVDEEYLNEHGGYAIIRGVDGEIYPCALDIFLDTYHILDQ